MVEYYANYDLVFQALADPTRRDLLRRVIEGEKSITELAKKYSLGFAAISKHLNVLESAFLISKQKQGRTKLVVANKQTITATSEYLKQYELLWDQRFNNLEKLIKEQL